MGCQSPRRVRTESVQEGGWDTGHQILRRVRKMTVCERVLATEPDGVASLWGTGTGGSETLVTQRGVVINK